MASPESPHDSHVRAAFCAAVAAIAMGEIDSDEFSSHYYYSDSGVLIQDNLATAPDTNTDGSRGGSVPHAKITRISSASKLKLGMRLRGRRASSASDLVEAPMMGGDGVAAAGLTSLPSDLSGFGVSDSVVRSMDNLFVACEVFADPADRVRLSGVARRIALVWRAQMLHVVSAHRSTKNKKHLCALVAFAIRWILFFGSTDFVSRRFNPGSGIRWSAAARIIAKTLSEEQVIKAVSAPAAPFGQLVQQLKLRLVAVTQVSKSRAAGSAWGTQKYAAIHTDATLIETESVLQELNTDENMRAAREARRNAAADMRMAIGVTGPSAIRRAAAARHAELFAGLSALQIARAETQIEFELFRRIPIRELLEKAWGGTGGGAGAPHISELIQRFNDLSYWVSTEILLAAGRELMSALDGDSEIKGRKRMLRKQRKVLLKFIKIAHAFWLLGNYNGLMAVLSGLSNHAVLRLKHLWATLSEKHVLMLEQLENIMNPTRNFANYQRELLERSNVTRQATSAAHGHVPQTDASHVVAHTLSSSTSEAVAVLPYLALFLREFTYFAESPTVLHDDGDGPQRRQAIVNMSLLNKLGQRALLVRLFQQTHFALSPDVAAIKFLAGLYVVEDHDLLEALSERVEPSRLITVVDVESTSESESSSDDNDDAVRPPTTKMEESSSQYSLDNSSEKISPAGFHRRRSANDDATLRILRILQTTIEELRDIAMRAERRVDRLFATTTIDTRSGKLCQGPMLPTTTEISAENIAAAADESPSEPLILIRAESIGRGLFENSRCLFSGTESTSDSKSHAYLFDIGEILGRATLSHLKSILHEGEPISLCDKLSSPVTLFDDSKANSYKSSTASVPPAAEELCSLLAYLTYSGFGKFCVESVRKVAQHANRSPSRFDKTDDNWVVLISMTESAEAVSWSNSGFPPEISRTCCPMVTGLIAGACSKAFGFSMIAVELQCVSAAARGELSSCVRECRFVVAQECNIDAQVELHMSTDADASAIAIPEFLGGGEWCFATRSKFQKLRRLSNADSADWLANSRREDDYLPRYELELIADSNADMRKSRDDLIFGFSRTRHTSSGLNSMVSRLVARKGKTHSLLDTLMAENRSHGKTSRHGPNWPNSMKNGHKPKQRLSQSLFAKQVVSLDRGIIGFKGVSVELEEGAPSLERFLFTRTSAFGPDGIQELAEWIAKKRDERNGNSAPSTRGAESVEPLEEALRLWRFISFDFGRSIGASDFSFVSAEANWRVGDRGTDSLEALHGLAEWLRQCGWGKAETSACVPFENRDEFYMRIDVENSSEVHAWRSYLTKPAGQRHRIKGLAARQRGSKISPPTCACTVLSGIISAWISRAFDRNLVAVEALCETAKLVGNNSRSTGVNNACVFLITTPECVPDFLQAFVMSQQHAGLWDDAPSHVEDVLCMLPRFCAKSV